GLTGVRAAYGIAPAGSSAREQGQIDAALASLNLIAPSWPLGAHGVALLQAWVMPEVQAWLLECLPTLRDWKARQIDMLQTLGWTCLPSEANFFCARPPQPIDLSALRADHGIKLRDCASFGLPGWVRLGVLGPQAQALLACGLQENKLTAAHLENLQ
ncbi:MAG: aminotransferase class I/II-fold pyridoxal phosphate-dependent enzyme, partial [Rhodoferax sp.]